MLIFKEMIKKIQEIIETLGWEKVESKNTKMISYTKDKERLNYYFTTGTVTFQVIGPWGKPETYKDVNTDIEMEKILSGR